MWVSERTRHATAARPWPDRWAARPKKSGAPKTMLPPVGWPCCSAPAEAASGECAAGCSLASPTKRRWGCVVVGRNGIQDFRVASPSRKSCLEAAIRISIEARSAEGLPFPCSKQRYHVISNRTTFGIESAGHVSRLIIQENIAKLKRSLAR